MTKTQAIGITSGVLILAIGIGFALFTGLVNPSHTTFAADVRTNKYTAVANAYYKCTRTMIPQGAHTNSRTVIKRLESGEMTLKAINVAYKNLGCDVLLGPLPKPKE